MKPSCIFNNSGIDKDDLSMLSKIKIRNIMFFDYEGEFYIAMCDADMLNSFLVVYRDNKLVTVNCKDFPGTGFINGVQIYNMYESSELIHSFVGNGKEYIPMLSKILRENFIAIRESIELINFTCHYTNSLLLDREYKLVDEIPVCLGMTCKKFVNSDDNIFTTTPSYSNEYYPDPFEYRYDFNQADCSIKFSKY